MQILADLTTPYSLPGLDPKDLDGSLTHVIVLVVIIALIGTPIIVTMATGRRALFFLAFVYWALSLCALGLGGALLLSGGVALIAAGGVCWFVGLALGIVVFCDRMAEERNRLRRQASPPNRPPPRMAPSFREPPDTQTAVSRET